MQSEELHMLQASDLSSKNHVENGDQSFSRIRIRFRPKSDLDSKIKTIKSTTHANSIHKAPLKLRIRSRSLSKKQISNGSAMSFKPKDDISSFQSLLSKVNLNSIINHETFFSLPESVQLQLSSFLPSCDITNSSPHSKSFSNTHLHTTALNNVFLKKALREFDWKNDKSQPSKPKSSPQKSNKSPIVAKTAKSPHTKSKRRKTDIPHLNISSKLNLVEITALSQIDSTSSIKMTNENYLSPLKSDQTTAATDLSSCLFISDPFTCKPNSSPTNSSGPTHSCSPYTYDFTTSPNDSAKIVSMPPPQQTKTLAVMREKLRAKRRLKDNEKIANLKEGITTPHSNCGGDNMEYCDLSQTSRSKMAYDDMPLTPLCDPKELAKDFASICAAAASSPDSNFVRIDLSNEISVNAEDADVKTKMDFIDSASCSDTVRISNACTLSIASSDSTSVCIPFTPPSDDKSNQLTKAFIIDGKCLPETIALLHGKNPNAKISQQQFLLIPNPCAKKSHLILCPTSTSTAAPTKSVSQPVTFTLQKVIRTTPTLGTTKTGVSIPNQRFIKTKPVTSHASASGSPPLIISTSQMQPTKLQPKNCEGLKFNGLTVPRPIQPAVKSNTRPLAPKSNKRILEKETPKKSCINRKKSAEITGSTTQIQLMNLNSPNGNQLVNYQLNNTSLMTSTIGAQQIRLTFPLENTSGNYFSNPIANTTTHVFTSGQSLPTVPLLHSNGIQNNFIDPHTSHLVQIESKTDTSKFLIPSQRPGSILTLNQLPLVDLNAHSIVRHQSPTFIQSQSAAPSTFLTVDPRHPIQMISTNSNIPRHAFASQIPDTSASNKHFFSNVLMSNSVTPIETSSPLSSITSGGVSNSSQNSLDEKTTIMNNSATSAAEGTPVMS